MTEKLLGWVVVVLLVLLPKAKTAETLDTPSLHVPGGRGHISCWSMRRATVIPSFTQMAKIPMFAVVKSYGPQMVRVVPNMPCFVTNVDHSPCTTARGYRNETLTFEPCPAFGDYLRKFAGGV
jgi:hypothetical protein